MSTRISHHTPDNKYSSGNVSPRRGRPEDAHQHPTLGSAVTSQGHRCRFGLRTRHTLPPRACGHKAVLKPSDANHIQHALKQRPARCARPGHTAWARRRPRGTPSPSTHRRPASARAPAAATRASTTKVDEASDEAAAELAEDNDAARRGKRRPTACPPSDHPRGITSEATSPRQPARASRRWLAATRVWTCPRRREQGRRRPRARPASFIRAPRSSGARGAGAPRPSATREVRQSAAMRRVQVKQRQKGRGRERGWAMEGWSPSRRPLRDCHRSKCQKFCCRAPAKSHPVQFIVDSSLPPRQRGDPEGGAAEF